MALISLNQLKTSDRWECAESEWTLWEHVQQVPPRFLELLGATNPMPHYVQPVQAPTMCLCSQTKVTSNTCPPQIVVVGLLPDLIVGRSPLSFYNR
jgi:hypothetical protein